MEKLDEMGVTYQYLDGSTPAKERQRRVDAFQAGEGELFLISLKAGGTGLNLTGADYVIHLDPWWNPAGRRSSDGPCSSNWSGKASYRLSARCRRDDRGADSCFTR